MSSFVKAMDNKANRVTIPEKPGTMVRATVGVHQQATLLELWVMLKRGTETDEISDRIQRIVRSCSSPNNGDAHARTELLSHSSAVSSCRSVTVATAVVRKMWCSAH